MRSSNAHEWALSSVAQDNTLYAIAICKRCGLTRSVIVTRISTEEKTIDLTGECPAAGTPEFSYG